jgi:pyruvate/oxaloacetate carboxyltransferase
MQNELVDSIGKITYSLRAYAAEKVRYYRKLYTTVAEFQEHLQAAAILFNNIEGGQLSETAAGIIGVEVAHDLWNQFDPNGELLKRIHAVEEAFGWPPVETSEHPKLIFR